MGASESIMMMIVICVGLMLFVIFSKPIKYILKMILQGCVGLIGIYIINFAVGSLGLSVGLNGSTFLISALLGLPGIFLLYGLQLTL